MAAIKPRQADTGAAWRAHETETQPRPAPDRTLLAGVAALPGGTPAAHAMVLGRVASSQPARAPRAFQQLQRQYGNRHVQRVVAAMRSAQNETEATAEVETAIAGARGAGQPLDSNVRGQMETSFGADFGGVRVHTGSEADTLNRAVHARAFTTGHDIFFRTGEYNPQSSGGRELLAHELTHVVQQTGAVRRKLAITQPGDVYEQEADLVARVVMQMEASPASRSARTLDRPGLALRLQRQFGGWVRGAIEAVGDVGGSIRDGAVNFLRERAQSIPGYELLGVILGRDPVTQQPIERNTTNLLRGLLSLVPNGQQMFENLQQSRVIERAFVWVRAELDRLNLTWAVIRGAIERFLNSLGAGDLLNLGGVLDRAPRSSRRSSRASPALPAPPAAASWSSSSRARWRWAAAQPNEC